MRPLPTQRYNTPANRPVVGVDDAGVGAIAGPVFAAAVLLPANWQPSMVAVDSKTLSLEARRAAFEAVCATPGLVWATAAVRARQVDTMGGHPATALAMELAGRLMVVAPNRFEAAPMLWLLRRTFREKTLLESPHHRFRLRSTQSLPPYASYLGRCLTYI